MKVWQVWDGDYDGDWVVATYDSEALANEHAATYGLRVDEVEVLSALPADVTDPALRAEREAERQAAAESLVTRRTKEAEDQERFARFHDTVTIDTQSRPSLCHCRLFTKDMRWISPHGHCRYCGGWTPEVFRAARGEAALSAEIDKLVEHERIAMRKLVGLTMVTASRSE